MAAHRLRFGAFVPQSVAHPDVLADALLAESLGFDNVWLLDHHAHIGAPEVPLLEAWTTLAALAVQTSTVRIGTLVTNVATRNPAMLAKAALTVDALSGGRLDVGIGAGYYEEEHAAIGVDFLDGRGRAERLAETAEILDRGLRGEPVTFEGRHYRLRDAPMRPEPVQRPRPPLFVAGHLGPSMRAAVDHGDAIVSFGAPGATLERAFEDFDRRMRRVDELCADAGRDPSTLRRCYFSGFAAERPFSSPEATADFVRRFADAGATDFSFTLLGPAQPRRERSLASGNAADRETLERVAREVLPLFA